MAAIASGGRSVSVEAATPQLVLDIVVEVCYMCKWESIAG
jgi:hypothetical protein